MLDKLRTYWDNIKAFFKRSEVIFYSRLQSLAGFILTVAGSIDWGAIAQLDWTTPKQTVWLGVGLIVNGTITELLRRRNSNLTV